MINNTNRVKGVEVLFTILFLVIVSGTLHAQTYGNGGTTTNSDMTNGTTNSQSNTWTNNTSNNTSNNTVNAAESMNTAAGR
jgi:hypothetical protein